MKRQLARLLLIVCLSAARAAVLDAAEAPGATPVMPVVAVIDFESGSLTTEMQAAFSQALWAEFYKEPLLRVLPRAESRRFLISQDLLPDPPYGPAVPLSRVAAALRADYVIAGHVNQVGSACALDYAVYSMKAGRVISKENIFRSVKIEDLMLQTPVIASSILSLIEQTEAGQAPEISSAAIRLPETSGTVSAASASITESGAVKETADAKNTKRADPAKKPGEQTRTREAVAATPTKTPAKESKAPTKAAAAPSDKAVAEAKPLLSPPPSSPPVANAAPPTSPAGNTPASIELSPEKGAATEPPKAGAAPVEPAKATAAVGDPAPSKALTLEPPPAPVSEFKGTRPAPTAEVPPPVDVKNAPVENKAPAAQEKAPAPQKPAAPATEKASSPPPTTTTAAPAPTAATPAPPAEKPKTPEKAEAPLPTPAAQPAVSEGNREAAKNIYKEALGKPAGSPERIESLKKAVVLDPTILDYKKSLAMSYYFAKDYPKSIEVCHSAIALAPKDSLLYTLLGSAHFESQQWSEAREAQERALLIDPDNLYSRFNLALTLQAQGAPDALAAWEDYLKRAENDPAQAENRKRARDYHAELKAKTP